MLHDREAFLLVAFFSFVMSNGTCLVTSQIHRLHLCVCRLDLLPLSLSVCLYAVTLSSKLSPEPPRASSDELKGKLPRSSRVEPRANGRRASEAIKRRAEHRAVERRAERRCSRPFGVFQRTSPHVRIALCQRAIPQAWQGIARRCTPRLAEFVTICQQLVINCHLFHCRNTKFPKIGTHRYHRG